MRREWSTGVTIIPRNEISGRSYFSCKKIGETLAKLVWPDLLTTLLSEANLFKIRRMLTVLASGLRIPAGSGQSPKCDRTLRGLRYPQVLLAANRRGNLP